MTLYYTPESRTSSPVQFKRSITYEHLQIKVVSVWRRSRYAGGIISAAIDGKKCALMIGESLHKKPRFNFK
jgi:uncharacterized FAD-dependent dehydrogenase